MKKIISTTRLVCWVMLLFLFQTIAATAQDGNTDISVLRMIGNSNHTSYFDTNIGLKSMLLDQGTSGAGTVEFWAKFQNNAQSLVLTSDALNNSGFSMKMRRDQISIESKGLSDGQSIGTPNTITDAYWQHFALVFYAIDNANNYNIDVYADGTKIKTFSSVQIVNDNDLFFAKGNASDEIYLAEIKAWNTKRKEEEINTNRYTSFYNYTGSAIEDQISRGLVANYSGDAEVMPINEYLPEVINTHWANTIQKDGYPSYGAIVSGIKSDSMPNELSLAVISSTMGNPIHELDQIIVQASKGKYDNQIELKWFHIDALSNYKIYRDNIEIGTENNVSRGTGELLFFVDEDALPGAIYTYKVRGTDSSGSDIRVGKDAGFIFPNGTVTGNIKTQSNVYVHDVGVAIGLSNADGVHGTAISFTPESNKITFLDRKLFVDNNDITIEFWYQNLSDGNETNTVFKLGATEILVGHNTTKIVHNNGSSTEDFTSNITDQQWHHYAYALGNDGIEVYVDGEFKGKRNTAFNWASSSVDFNYYINHETKYEYALDEFRVWNGKKDSLSIRKTMPYVVDANHTDLLVAYSMDLQGSKEMYNHAQISKGSYVGKSKNEFVYIPQHSGLKYAAFTDENGNYEFSSIYSNSPTGNSFTATAFKPNHDFRPATVGVNIKQSSITSEYSKIADFTDISELPVAGRIYYLDYDNLGNEKKYPVPAGKQIAIDGSPLIGIGEGLESDAAGVYSVSSSLGLHEFEVFNPELDNNLNLNCLSFSPVEAENIITSGGYAVSKRSVNYKDNGITLSGFVKPYISVVLPEYAAPKQTLVQWGSFEVVLQNNNMIQFLYNGSLQKELALTNPNAFNYFAISVSDDGHYGFMLNENHKTGLISGVNFSNSLLYLGAEVDSNGNVSKNNLSNLTHIQFRTTNYDASQMLAIKDGTIIPEDQEHLALSFDFGQEKGNRAISTTPEGKRNYLVLHDNAIIDATQVYTHTQKYQYDYRAVNPDYNPEEGSALYSLNVVDPMTSVDFEMKDRYGFIGNIVIPCDNTIGAWTGVITRTDSESPKFERTINTSHFNSEQNIFMVDGLIPGKYQVTLTNVEDPSIELISPILDLTKGWQTYDFEYRAPLSIAINGYMVKEEKVSTPLADLKEEDFDLLQKVCDNDFYVLGEGNPVLMQVEIFEQYGDQKCVVPNATVTFSGGLLKMPNGSSSVTAKTDENGHVVLTSFAATPNFVAPHTRNLTIGVSHDNRHKQEVVSGLIEGARMNDSDFTIADPIVNYVLHDPPGDGSSMTLKEGTTSVTTGKWNASLGYTGTLSSQLGADFKQDLVATVFGFGTSITALEAEVTAGIDTKFTVLGTYNGSTSTQVVNSKDISTSSSDRLIGKNADLFIGTGYLITVGSGQTLAYDQATCSVAYSTNSPVMDNKIDNSFVHSYYDIKKNMIPNLLTAIANEQDPNQIRSYQNSVEKWINNLVRNDMVLNLYDKSDYAFMEDHAFLVDQYNALPASLDTNAYNWETYKKFENFEANRSFDGGGSAFTQNITTSNTLSNGADFSTSFDFGYKTVVKGTVAGVSSEFTYSNAINTSLGGGFDITNGDDTVVQYTLTDDDAGDRFAIEIKRDPNFAVPIYRTLAGQSSCPAERGTQIRTGVELEAEQTIANGIVGDVLRYTVKLRNTQIADSPKSYTLSLSPASNPTGAVVRINGALANGGSPISFYFGADDDSPTGIVQEIEAEIEISVPSTETASSIEYKDLKFVYSVPCEFHDDIGFTHNADVYEEAGIKSIDVLYLTAQFNGACVEGMDQLLPQDNWVINASNNNLQDFAFTIPGTTVEEGEVTLPESLTAVDIEYALADNNTPRLLKTITKNELKTIYSENAFRLAVDVSGLVDGEYGFRFVPVCGDGNEVWRRNVPTPYAYGIISRKAPLLLETNPAEGGMLSEGSIIATYDSALDPTTLTSLNIALRGTLGGLPKELTSVDFNNVTDQITIPHGEFLTLESGYTIEFWANPTSYPINGAINLLNKGSNYSLSLLPNGRLNYSSNPSGSSTGAVLPLQEWTHVAMVYDGASTLNFYFNGVLVHSDTGFNNNAQDVIPSQDHLLIGGTSLSGEGFIGQLDELRIWDTTQSHNKIVTNQSRQLLGNEAHLRAYYVFDNNALEVNGYQEAVRDYTGNTARSSHTGISWVTGNEAAPISREQLVQDIPITIATNIDNNQVIINPLNFQEYFLEGAKLTAIFSDNTIRGVDGNIVEGHNWSFTINKNNVEWDKANITSAQTVGTSITINALLKNTGGADATFELQSLPEWLQSTDTNIGSSVDLPAGFEQPMTFTTSAYLNKGTYHANIGVISYNVDGVQTGYEYFALELNVGCDAPDYSFNASNYAFKKEFTAELIVGGELSQDTNDVVVAYFNDEIRGRGQIRSINNKNLVLIDVFHNPGESGNLRFSVWDDSNCKEYIGLTELYTIGNGSSEGTIVNPVTFETGEVVIKRIPLLQGYQWVSFNSITHSEATDLHVSSLKGMENGDQIIDLSTGKSANFGTNGIATGELSFIDYTKAYQIKSMRDKLMWVEGAEASIKTDITINGSYTDNYVGYIPDVMLNAPYALRSLSNRFTIGDRISGREGFSEFTNEGWKGTLTHLIPNKAYSIKMLNEGTLNYSGIVGNINAVRTGVNSTIVEEYSTTMDMAALNVGYIEHAASKGIVVDTHLYPATMSLTASIVSDQLDQNKEYVLAAFYNNETRGIAKAVYNGDELVYFMTIYGNKQEDITFKLFTDYDSYEIDNSILFANHSFKGSIEKAYPLYVTDDSVTNTESFFIDKNPIKDAATLTVTPIETDTYEISMYNVLGAKVATLFSGKLEAKQTTRIKLNKNTNASISDLPSGIYICTMRGANTNNTLKIILE